MIDIHIPRPDILQLIQNTKSVTRKPIILILNIGAAVAQFVISYAAKYDKISANSYCGKLEKISNQITFKVVKKGFKRF